MSAKKKPVPALTFKDIADAIDTFFDIMQYWSSSTEIEVDIGRIIAIDFNKWTWPEGDEKAYLKALKPLLKGKYRKVQEVNFGYAETTSVYITLQLKKV